MHLLGSGFTAEVAVRLQKLETAISKQRTVVFRYWAISSDEEAVRTVDPYSLYLMSGHWYVIGRDHDRDDVRTFRLDRMRGDVRFATRRERDFRVPPEFDPERLPQPRGLAARRERRGRDDPRRRPTPPGWPSAPSASTATVEHRDDRSLVFTTPVRRLAGARALADRLRRPRLPALAARPRRAGRLGARARRRRARGRAAPARGAARAGRPRRPPPSAASRPSRPSASRCCRRCWPTCSRPAASARTPSSTRPSSRRASSSTTRSSRITSSCSTSSTSAAAATPSTPSASRTAARSTSRRSSTATSSAARRGSRRSRRSRCCSRSTSSARSWPPTPAPRSTTCARSSRPRSGATTCAARPRRSRRRSTRTCSRCSRRPCAAARSSRSSTSGGRTTASSAASIEPHYLRGVRGDWYCDTWDRTRDGERTFRVDRIREAKALGETFERRESVTARVDGALGDRAGTASVWFSADVARWELEEPARHRAPGRRRRPRVGAVRLRALAVRRALPLPRRGGPARARGAARPGRGARARARRRRARARHHQRAVTVPQARWLSDAEVAALLPPPAEAAELARAVLVELAEGTIELPPKPVDPSAPRRLRQRHAGVLRGPGRLGRQARERLPRQPRARAAGDQRARDRARQRDRPAARPARRRRADRLPHGGGLGRLHRAPRTGRPGPRRDHRRGRRGAQPPARARRARAAARSSSGITARPTWRRSRAWAGEHAPDGRAAHRRERHRRRRWAPRS